MCVDESSFCNVVLSKWSVPESKLEYWLASVYSKFQAIDIVVSHFCAIRFSTFHVGKTVLMMLCYRQIKACCPISEKLTIIWLIPGKYGIIVLITVILSLYCDKFLYLKSWSHFACLYASLAYNYTLRCLLIYCK